MSNEINTLELAKLLAELLKAVPESPGVIGGLSASKAKRLRNELESVIVRLRILADRLDPIRRPDFIFDPSNPEFIGQLIGRTLLEQQRNPLGNLQKFYGSGVYAIYYRGPFSAYRPIRSKEIPVYVGKADPPTPDAKTVVEQGPKLWGRLAEHAKSIRAARTTLDISEFDCRFLVVQSGWQRSAEDYLIHQFHPIWNQSICYGFGKHGDDPKTRSNTRSPWDTLHPGRTWATRDGNRPNAIPAAQIAVQIAEHFRKHVPQS